MRSNRYSLGTKKFEGHSGFHHLIYRKIQTFPDSFWHRPSSLGSMLFLTLSYPFTTFIFCGGQRIILVHYRQSHYIEVAKGGVERWQFCLQETSRSANCHRRAAVGHCFIVCVKCCRMVDSVPIWHTISIL